MNSLMLKLKLTLLGTGTPRPSAQRAGSSYLVEFDSQRLLFDCGPGALQRLLQAGVSPVEAAMLLKGLAEIMEPENVSEWLATPNKNYRNKSPLDLIGSGRSDIIWSMIERARQGSFA